MKKDNKLSLRNGSNLISRMLAIYLRNLLLWRNSASPQGDRTSPWARGMPFTQPSTTPSMLRPESEAQVPVVSSGSCLPKAWTVTEMATRSFSLSARPPRWISFLNSLTGWPPSTINTDGLPRLFLISPRGNILYMQQ